MLRYLLGKTTFNNFMCLCMLCAENENRQPFSNLIQKELFRQGYMIEPEALHQFLTLSSLFEINNYLITP